MLLTKRGRTWTWAHTQGACRCLSARLYVKKCLGCSERIAPEELVMRALDSVFHVRCFVCVVCGARLQKGDQFVIKQGQLFCRPDYEKEVEMLQGYAQAKQQRTLEGNF
ncbi:LIM homeobox transcription factor 1-beta-like [Schistocerca cancellata]|uniref:LIM homeobox transcription factor 1-beta-like n=1 Tax=Schistocerca cancellata TaxID=274614 RepID=UPI00211845BE|nr:LIM homeobox transcription factor 1-beta-like [Schistocerca cancellata]